MEVFLFLTMLINVVEIFIKTRRATALGVVAFLYTKCVIILYRTYVRT